MGTENRLKSGCEALARGRQEQIAASHEIDGVRKEKERLTGENPASELLS